MAKLREAAREAGVITQLDELESSDIWELVPPRNAHRWERLRSPCGELQSNSGCLEVFATEWKLKHPSVILTGADAQKAKLYRISVVCGVHPCPVVRYF